MIRSFRYPVYLTKDQDALATTWLASSCDLYNGALQEWKSSLKRSDAPKVTYASQSKALTEIRAADERWRNIPVEVSRSALRKRDRASAAYYRRCREQRHLPPEEKRLGFPRYKSKRTYDSVTFQVDVRLRDGKLILPKMSPIKVHLYRPIPEHGKILDAILQRRCGKWYIIFQVDLGDAPPKRPLASIPEARQVGIDLGLRTLATLSTGKKEPNPHHGREAQAKLARRQQALVRKKRGSKRRRRALLLVQKAYLDIQNRRKDTCYKLAAKLVRDFDLICFENLTIRNMVMGILGKAIHDASWRMLVTAIEHKAESAGAHAVAVDARGTSQECSRCGAKVPKDLSVRIHRCPHCGLVLDRDHNASLNILSRGRRDVGLIAMGQVTTAGSA